MSAEKKLVFSLFSDFHYKKGMYASTLEDMLRIFGRAARSQVDFVLHGGDFCNDYIRSPELTRLYLDNPYGLTVYGVYGNHELETMGNTMARVTPMLTNDPRAVFESECGYYYADINGFRLVCTDTNYSWNEAASAWQHNAEGSYGPPKGNLRGNSLGPDQLLWLERVLTEAANQALSCVVIGHCGFCGQWGVSPDAEKVRAIYSKVNALRPRTVLMSINGHYHTHHLAVEDGILFMDVNTARNGCWIGNQTADHYAPAHTYPFADYDADALLIGTRPRALSELTQARNTWFFADPLDAIVTVRADGVVTIEGSETSWMYDVRPPITLDGMMPAIPGGTFAL